MVVPRDSNDVVAATEVCRRHGAPIVSRGCATGLAGQTCNVAVVIDHSQHLRSILDVDPEGGRARIQPGVIRDQLARRVEGPYGLTFGPDTSTHAYATLGGMIGNNSCGTHSVLAGRTADNIHELEVVTYDGVRMTVGRTSDAELEAIVAAGGRRGEIYAAMRDLRDRYADAIRERYPDIPRRVSGYNLDELLPERGFDVARALVGSEGTLATVLEATVRLVPSPPARTLVVCAYPDVFSAADHVPEILEHGPIGLEGLDEVLIRDMRTLGTHVEDLSMLPDGKGWLLVEFGGETTEESDGRAHECMERLAKLDGAPEMKLFDVPANESKLWDIRESGLGATAFIPAEDDHWEGWEDAAVPPERLGEYLRGFRSLLDRYDYRTSIYGHFGGGCVHCRINFDLRSHGGIEHWRAFLDEAADLVVSHGGSLSGEHGDGQSRAELLERMYGAGAGRGVPGDEADLGPAEPDEPAQGRRPLSDRLESEARGRLRAARGRCPLLLPRGRRQLRPRDRCAASGPASAATTRPGRCARASPRPTTRSTRRGGGPERSTRCSRAGRSPTASARPRSATRSISASPARAASRTARSASTWPPTRPSSSTSTTSDGCVRWRPTRWA